MKRLLRLVLATCALATGAISSPVHAGQKEIDSPVPEIGVLAQPFNILTSVNARFVLDANVRNSLDGKDTLQFLLHRRIAARDSFASIAKGEVVPGVSDSFTVAMSRVGRDYAGHLEPIVPIITTEKTSSALSISQDGVYPITIQITDFQTKKILSSVLTFVNRRTLSATTQNLSISPLLRLTAPALLKTDGIIELDDATRESVKRMIAFLGSFTGPVTISISPQIITALGESALPTDQQLFLDLRNQLRRRSIATDTFAPCDPAEFAGLGLQQEFISQMKLGEATLNRFLPGVTIQRNAWVATERLNPDAVALLRDAGITNILLSDNASIDATTELPASIISHPVGAENKNISVVSHVSDFVGVISTNNTAEKNGYTVAAEAIVQGDDLVSAAMNPALVHMLISLPIGSIDQFQLMTTATKALSNAPGFTLIDMAASHAVDNTTSAISFGPAPDKWNTSRVPSIQSARTELNAVTSMLSEDDARRYTWAYLLGVGASPSLENANAYISALRKQLRATRQSVTVTTPAVLNLSSRNGSIRIQIRNGSAENLTVRVRFNSAKLSLVNPSRIITLPSGSTTEVVVSATTRTSGQFPVSVWVATPQGNLEVVPLITIRAKVTAIAGFGQFVSISFLLILLAWWWSHRRSARRDQREATTVSEQ